MNLNRNMKLKHFSKKNDKYKKRLFRLSVISLLLIGIIYQQIGIYYQARHLGRMGRLVDVNGTNMHIYEAGSSNIPLVFTSDIGSNVPYVETYLLHNALSKKHQVTVYDKPGYGWSDFTSASRDIDTISKEIHTLLHSSEIPDDEDTYIKPFIFVAYGMGSFEALRYAQLYPEDVAGIVLIEGASPSFGENFNNIMIIESFLTNGLRNTGLLRLLSGTNIVANILNIHKDYEDHLKKLNNGIALEKTWNRNVISEKLKVPENATTILEGGDLGDIPIRVITSEANVYSNWNKTQRSLLSLSSDTEQFFIKGSTDYIEQGDVKEILSVIEGLVTHVEELRENS